MKIHFQGDEGLSCTAEGETILECLANLEKELNKLCGTSDILITDMAIDWNKLILDLREEYQGYYRSDFSTPEDNFRITIR